MPPTPAEDLDRITEYVSGDLPPEKIKEAERWIAEDEQRQALVQYLQGSRKALKVAQRERVDMERLISGVAHRIGEPIGLPYPKVAGFGHKTIPVLVRRVAEHPMSLVMVLCVVGAIVVHGVLRHSHANMLPVRPALTASTSTFDDNSTYDLYPSSDVPFVVRSHAIGENGSSSSVCRLGIWDLPLRPSYVPSDS